MNENEMIAAAIKQFPATFGLQNFPGEVFRLSASSSYLSGNEVMLYTQVEADKGVWLDFAKGTIAELKAQLV